MSDPHVRITAPDGWNAACSCGYVARDGLASRADDALARHIKRSVHDDGPIE